MKRGPVEVAQNADAAPRSGKSGGANTRQLLLTAAKSCLLENGYNVLSTRQVALVAGVPLSQIHYHFGSKQGLLLALFEDLNRTLLKRQTEMFSNDLPLWRQWQIACDYLDEDLQSGFVRVLNELTAAGWSDPEIGAAVRNVMVDWYGLLRDVAARAGAHFGGLGPLAPEDVAALVGGAFMGAEMNLLSGQEGPEIPVRRALRRFGDVLRQWEQMAKSGG